MDELMELIKRIEFVVFDVDGVLTDGRIVYDGNGIDSKFFYVHDGLGISLLKYSGIEVAFMSAKSSAVIKRRASDCRVEYVLEDIGDKKQELTRLAEKLGYGLDKICFVGDDLVDIGAMKIVGLPVAVANAVPEVKAVAKYITKNEGGRGAVRELAELILKTKGLWGGIIEKFS